MGLVKAPFDPEGLSPKSYEVRMKDNIPFKEAEALRLISPSSFSQQTFMSSVPDLMNVEGLVDELRKQTHGLKTECCLRCHRSVYRELCEQK